jgi:hypothetical protein
VYVCYVRDIPHTHFTPHAHLFCAICDVHLSFVWCSGYKPNALMMTDRNPSFSANPRAINSQAEITPSQLCVNFVSHVWRHQTLIGTYSYTTHACLYTKQWITDIVHDVNRDSSVSTATGYGLHGRGIGVWFPGGTRDFSLVHSVHTGSGAHPACIPVGTEGSFPRGKANDPHPSSVEVKNSLAVPLFPIRLHCVMRH